MPHGNGSRGNCLGRFFEYRRFANFAKYPTDLNSRLIAGGNADRMHRTSSCDYCDLSAPLIQADCCHLAALISSTGDSTLAVPGGQSNNLDNQCQDMEGSSQNVQRVAPNRDTFGGDEN